jgi:hypothetical protein
MKQWEGNLRRLPGVLGLAAVLGLSLHPARAHAQSEGFHVSSLGVLTVKGTDTYYDGSNGSLFMMVPLPSGASALQFRVTGVVTTDGTDRPASADGLYADGRPPYNFSNTRFLGTYQGVPIGSTTGIDPALFGVFFSPDFTGTPADSLNYRSDSGIDPDPRRLPFYTPSVNQPFWIGDGYDSNNPFETFDDDYVPPGMNQTFFIPDGATFLLLGIGADPDLSDNQPLFHFKVHVFDNSGNRPNPEPASWALLGLGGLSLLGYALRRPRRRQA